MWPSILLWPLGLLIVWALTLVWGYCTGYDDGRREVEREWEGLE